MPVPSLRLIFFGGFALILTGLIQPTTVQACCPPASEFCQAATSHEAPSRHETSSPERCPFKSAQTDQCCAGCPLTFSLIDAAAAAPLIFAEGNGTILLLRDHAFLTRSDRPPYPPPRA